MSKSDDTISRQKAIEAFQNVNLNIMYGDVAIGRRDYMTQKEAVKIIENLPSAQPRWIPCSETVDIPDHEVLACDKYGEEILGYLEYADDQWICESEGCVMYDPIAWMEKPEPYRGGQV